MAANYHNERIFVGTVFSRPKQGGELLRNSETGYDRYKRIDCHEVCQLIYLIHIFIWIQIGKINN